MTKSAFNREMMRFESAWDNDNNIKNIICRSNEMRRYLNKKGRRLARKNLKKAIDKEMNL